MKKEVVTASDVKCRWLGDVQPLPRDGFEISAPYRPHTHVIYALMDDMGVFYIGQTICSKAYRRVSNHITAARTGRDRNKLKVHRLLNAVSGGYLKVRIVSFASSQDAANHLEKFYMFFFGFQEGKLTNIVQGGVGGFDPSGLEQWNAYIYSDENRLRASSHAKTTWKDPMKKASMIDKVKACWTDEKKQSQRDKMKALWVDPDYVNKVMAARSTPELVEQSERRNRDVMTKRWEDQQYRDSQIAERRSRANDPAWIEKMRAINKEVGARPEVRQKRSENMKAAWTPERRKKHSELIKSRAAAKRSARGDAI